VLNHLRVKAAKSVLDLGCGNGSFAAEVAAHGFAVTGLDHSASGIEMARGKYPNVSFSRHDLTQPLGLEHAGQYDAAICTEVIEHLLLPRVLLKNAWSALRPGGMLVLTTPFHGYWKNLALALAGHFDAHWHPLRDYGHIKFFSRATLLQLLRESGFKDLQFATAGRIGPLAKSMIVAGTKPR